ncbi:GH1 family beta-glucosidase [Salsipaludibacter albus]|uniref:GH1 family beta-glucosidase n=1 Tax=Salsipaludibacter albus TaxID=2849650 RepID=UPI001EE4146D|nr:GH1 family beta-glucosidase [Salsipaludibacter albus]MBY5162528.1 beta-glucosidase [Salsipaludibacter albus]
MTTEPTRTSSTGPSPQEAGVDPVLLAHDIDLPSAFRWGAATSSHQIEGAHDVDGRTPSIWDTFAATPGRVRNGDTAQVAVDHYHRWEEDLDLLAWLGVDEYRFSIAWSRVLPDGSGRPNQAGLDFYRRLVDGLHERGIEPNVTLYHWDLPQWLQDRGGWAARETVDAFVHYAATVAQALGTVVTWATLNEPWCAAFLGHRAGVHAPGHTDQAEAVAACHHLLLAHGRAVGTLRDVAAHARDDAARLGIVLNLAPVRTSGTRPEDLEAVRVVDGGRNRAWLGPLFRGAYPDDVLADWSAVADLSVVQDGDLDEIATPIDWLGLNYYNPIWVRAGDGSSPEPGADGVVEDVPADAETTAMGWPIDASGLVDVVRRVVDDHAKVPLVVTENGGAFPDRQRSGGLADGAVDDAPGGGMVQDEDRIRYLQAHLQAIAGLVADGVDLRGYHVWSLLDNFEWAEGYDFRFGIVEVDDELVRIPKASAHWYRHVLADHARRGHGDD